MKDMERSSCGLIYDRAGRAGHMERGNISAWFWLEVLKRRERQVGRLRHSGRILLKWILRK
jgi:hypothetical protein